MINTTKLVIGLLISATASLSHAEDLSTYSNEIESINVQSIETQSIETKNTHLYRWLEMESRMRYVNESINIKEQAMRDVYDLNDFEIISRYAFQNPSVEYRQAVGDFIVRHIGNILQRQNSYRSLEILLTIESRAHLVRQAEAIKTAALRIVRNEYDFVALTRSAFATPSQAYREMLSRFIGANIAGRVSHRARISTLLQIESQAYFVSDAIKVKEAGLVIVRTRYDLYDLAAYAFPNPSDGYRNAVNDFIRRNLSRYP